MPDGSCGGRPGGNPTLSAVSKLFRRSVQRAATSGLGAHHDEEDAANPTNYTTPHQKITRQVLLAFSLGGDMHARATSSLDDPSDESMNAIPYCSSDDETEEEDVYSDPPPRKHYPYRELEQPDNQQPKKRKTSSSSSSSFLGTLSSLWPADSEDDDGDGCYNNHKRHGEFESCNRPARNRNVDILKIDF